VREGKKLHKPYRPFDPYFLDKASFIIVGTEQGKQEVIEAFGAYPGKVRVIPFATPTLPGRTESEPDARRPPYLFYPARFWPHKNQIVLVYALKFLRDRWGIVPHCVLSGIDNGNLSYVMRTAEKLGVREQIEYLGNVSLQQLAELYRNAIALVYCSALGPDNFPPLEAMSVGCPVVAADVPGAREQYGDAAIFFSPTNEIQLAECIKTLLDNADLRKGLIERGLHRAARWTPVDYGNSVLKVLDEFAALARMWEHCEFVCA
jgi:glycosyltransferase involved in cell wall biosynthesis